MFLLYFTIIIKCTINLGQWQIQSQSIRAVPLVKVNSEHTQIEKIQTSLRAPPPPLQSDNDLSCTWYSTAMSLKADSGPDQTARMRSLIWALAARICSEGLFLQGLAPIQSWMLNYKIHQCWKLKLHTLRKLHFMPFLGEFTRLIKSNWTSPRSFQIQRHERRL